MNLIRLAGGNLAGPILIHHQASAGGVRLSLLFREAVRAEGEKSMSGVAPEARRFQPEYLASTRDAAALKSAAGNRDTRFGLRLRRRIFRELHSGAGCETYDREAEQNFSHTLTLAENRARGKPAPIAGRCR